MTRIGTIIRNRLLTPLRIKFISGLNPPALNAEDVVVLCLCRDEDVLIEGFLDHYRNLGVAHFVFTDNGSVDRTMDIISDQPDCTLLSTTLPFSHYREFIKGYMVRKFALGRWSILVDADEFFDYPGSNRVSLKRLTAYLDSHGYNALYTPMLDMFSTAPAPEWSMCSDGKFVKKDYPYFDLEDIDSRPLTQAVNRSNKLGSPELKYMSGGIRKRIFETENALVKYALARFYKGRPYLRTTHKILKGNIADFSGVLFHYKLIGSFVAKAFQYAEEGNHWKDSYEYKKYREALMQNDQLVLSTPGMEKFTSMDQLVENGFLVVSEQYNKAFPEWVGDTDAEGSQQKPT